MTKKDEIFQTNFGIHEGRRIILNNSLKKVQAKIFIIKNELIQRIPCGISCKWPWGQHYIMKYKIIPLCIGILFIA